MIRIVLSLSILAASAFPASAFECNVCHSKNPAMVKMHKALKGRNCFDCHKVGQRLMGKGPKKDIASSLQRREQEPICFECHRK